MKRLGNKVDYNTTLKVTCLHCFNKGDIYIIKKEHYDYFLETLVIFNDADKPMCIKCNKPMLFRDLYGNLITKYRL